MYISILWLFVDTVHAFLFIIYLTSCVQPHSSWCINDVIWQCMYVEMHVWFLPVMIGTWSVNAGKRWQMVCIYLHHCPLLVVDTIYQGISSFQLHPSQKWTWKLNINCLEKAKKTSPNLPSFGFLDENGKPHIAIATGCFWRKNPGVVWWGRLCFVEGGRWQGYLRGSMKWGDI